MRALLLVPALLLVAAGDPASEVAVVVHAKRFDPASVEVARGTLVTFHRRDPGPETYRIVSEDGAIRSWAFEQHTQWPHRFDAPGRYELFLEEHPDTRVLIHVR